jgi:hypothetical protein
MLIATVLVSRRQRQLIVYLSGCATWRAHATPCRRQHSTTSEDRIPFGVRGSCGVPRRRSHSASVAKQQSLRTYPAVCLHSGSVSSAGAARMAPRLAVDRTVSISRRRGSQASQPRDAIMIGGRLNPKRRAVPRRHRTYAGTGIAELDAPAAPAYARLHGVTCSWLSLRRRSSAASERACENADVIAGWPRRARQSRETSRVFT